MTTLARHASNVTRLTMLVTGGVGCTEEAAGAIPRGRKSRAVSGSRGLRTAAAGLLSLGGGTDCFTLYARMIDDAAGYICRNSKLVKIMACATRLSCNSTAVGWSNTTALVLCSCCGVFLLYAWYSRRIAARSTPET